MLIFFIISSFTDHREHHRRSGFSESHVRDDGYDRDWRSGRTFLPTVLEEEQEEHRQKEQQQQQQQQQKNTSAGLRRVRRRSGGYVDVRHRSRRRRRRCPRHR